MSKEARSIFLVVLTLVFYAVSIALKPGGSFVFPFPLNPFFFFAVAIYFVFLHYRLKAVSFMVSGVALFGILASPVLWEIILPVKSMETFYNYPWIYWFHLLYGLAITVWAFYAFIKQKDLLAKIFTLLGAVLFCIGHVIGDDTFLFISLAFLAFSVLYKPVYQPFNLLWLLLFILESSKWINFLIS